MGLIKGNLRDGVKVEAIKEADNFNSEASTDSDDQSQKQMSYKSKSKKVQKKGD